MPTLTREKEWGTGRERRGKWELHRRSKSCCLQIVSAVRIFRTATKRRKSRQRRERRGFFLYLYRIGLHDVMAIEQAVDSCITVRDEADLINSSLCPPVGECPAKDPPDTGVRAVRNDLGEKDNTTANADTFGNANDTSSSSTSSAKRPRSNSQNITEHQPPQQKRKARRNRNALACEECRTRKRRCDGDAPACGSCVQRSCHCVYSTDTQGKGWQTRSVLTSSQLQHFLLL